MHLLSSLVYLARYLQINLDEVYFDSSRLLCLLECIRCLNSNQWNRFLVWIKSKVLIVTI